MADMTVTRPRVFLSSTIKDMADLREALKFWLEEMGYEVQLSEHNDFQRSPDSGTFEACFESIRQSDYYILLIGMRPGSWYHEQDRITVTQQEYRTAYESWRHTGKPKLVSFVRHDVVTALRERQKGGATQDTPSLLDDAELTAEFIREVRRENETAEAVAGAAPYPSANWLTDFATFRQLTDGLRSALQMAGPLPKVALLENIRWELERNLRMTMINHDTKPFYHHFLLADLHRDVTLKLEDSTGEIELEHAHVKHLVMYLVAGPPAPSVFIRSALDHTILSGALLDYDTARDRFITSPLLEALYQLREELDIYTTRFKSVEDDRKQVLMLWARISHGDEGGPFPVLSLASLLALDNTLQNISRVILGLLRHLYGHADEVAVQYRPLTPFAGQEAEIQGQRVSSEQLQQWLEKDSLLLKVGSTDQTQDEKRRKEELMTTMKELLGEDKMTELLEEILERES